MFQKGCPNMNSVEMKQYVCGVLLWLLCGSVGQLFDEDALVALKPKGGAESFGYSLLVRNSSELQLVVGAPSAQSTHAAHEGLGGTGAIYTCPLDLTGNPRTISCPSLEFDTAGNTRESSRDGRLSVHHYKNEMWLGGSLAASDQSLVMCAPRWCNQVTSGRSEHRLINGMCYVKSQKNRGLLLPLVDKNSQAYVAREQNFTKLNYFAYGQAGFSAAVTPDNSYLLLGAPGLLQWTGGVARYVISKRGPDELFLKQTVVNPYYTAELHQDSYFGYSVDSGVFEVGGPVLGVSGAPRGADSMGQVLIFELNGTSETSPLQVKASLKGAQLGSYFGSALLVTDLNADGRADLLVGAPLYVNRDKDTMPYDQGIVYVYINQAEESGFSLVLAGTLSGSEASGARFGSALADLGDVDDADQEPYPEIAVGAPWESDGRGAVYIYRANKDGVASTFVQKISSESRGFGYSMARGIDVDGNGCNDLIVGAVKSDKAILYPCLRSIYLRTQIRLPGALDLPENATSFQASFCVTTKSSKQISSSGVHPTLDVTVELSVDAGGGRAALVGDAASVLTIQPGNTYCKEEFISIHSSADLTRPIIVSMTVRATAPHPHKGVVIGEGSQLSSSVEVQLTRDCGEDHVCHPSLRLSAEPLSSPYVPGSADLFGATVGVRNDGEPAYSACVLITLPSPPLRVPSDCRLHTRPEVPASRAGYPASTARITCELPKPFPRRASVNWTLEMDAWPSMQEYVLPIRTSVFESCAEPRGKAQDTSELNLLVTPVANVSVIGSAFPNASLTISRQSLSEEADIDFYHSFTITNHGPSDLPALEIYLFTPHQVSLVKLPPGCTGESGNVTQCTYSITTRQQTTVQLHFTLSLRTQAYLLEENTVELVTLISVPFANITEYVLSELTLEPATPIWPIVLASTLAGLLVVGLLSYGLYKCGFFGREQRERLRRLMQDELRMHHSQDLQDILQNDDDELDDRSREPSPLNVYAVQ